MPEHEPQVGQAERSITCEVGFADAASVGGGDHRVDQVHRLLFGFRAELDLSGFHRATRDEHGRNVEPQSSHQHAGRDLVAVRNADKPVGAVRVHHIFDAVGDQIARRKAVEHAVMPHRDAVIDRNGVELLGDATGRLDFTRDQLS